MDFACSIIQSGTLCFHFPLNSGRFGFWTWLHLSFDLYVGDFNQWETRLSWIDEHLINHNQDLLRVKQRKIQLGYSPVPLFNGAGSLISIFSIIELLLLLKDGNYSYD